MRRHSTLRAPSGSRGVQNGGVIVWLNVCTRVRVAKWQHFFPLIYASWQWLLCAHYQHFDVLLHATCRTNVETLLIANEHGCTGVFKREIHFVFCPPRVHRHVDGTYRDD